MVSDNFKKIRNHLLLAVILIFSMVSVSQAVGLGGAGFDSQEVQTLFFFYIGPGIAFLVGIIALFVLMTRDGEGARYGDSIAFSSSGESPAILSKISIPKMILLSLIVFSFLGLYITYTNQTFFEIGLTQQQFTPAGSLIYSGALIPASENLGAAFLLALSLYGLRKWSKKNNFSPTVYKALAILSALVVFAIYGMINHLLRYGDSQMAVTSVAFFWAIGGLITIFTGSFIPFWIMHISNNFFLAVSKYFSSDIIYGGTIGFIILLGVTYALIYMRSNKIKGVN